MSVQALRARATCALTTCESRFALHLKRKVSIARRLKRCKEFVLTEAPAPSRTNIWNARCGTTVDAARAIVHDVAERLRRGADAIDEGGIAAGDAGIALFFGALDRDAPNDGWDAIAHGFLKRGADRIGTATPHIGLFGGLAGLGYTTAFLSRGGARYRRVQAEIDAALLPAAESAARALAPQTGMRVEEYDLVSGLSGVAASLLDRLHDERVHATARIIIEALVAIVQRTGPVPAWYTPANLITSKEMIGRFPDGALNCGLAHGLPGVLSVLALARCAGLRVHGLDACDSRRRGLAGIAARDRFQRRLVAGRGRTGLWDCGVDTWAKGLVLWRTRRRAGATARSRCA